MEQQIFTKTQLLILKHIADDKFLHKQFYLTGGTALAGFYLHHRLSEDLDFFSEQEFDVTGISSFFKKNKATLGIDTIDFQQSYNRNLFFLHFPHEVVKMEFTYFPFPRIEPTHEQLGIHVDGPLDIAVNKLFTIYQRTTARDYIDLYCIVQKYGWSVDELYKKAKIKFDWHIDPLQLGTQFMKAQTVADMPKMIDVIPESAWRGFFLDEAKKLKSQIFQ